MKIGLDQLMQPKLLSLVADSRRYYEAKKSLTANKNVPDLTTPEGLSEARRSRLSSRPEDVNLKVTLESIRSNTRIVPIRILLPKKVPPRAVLLNIPGGGFYLSEAARNDSQNAYLAEKIGIAVIAVDYRLAPENPWPAAHNDCFSVADWLIRQSERRFGTSRLIIGGSSAGANLAMTALLRLRDMDLAATYIGAALQFGAYDLSGQTPGGRLYADEYFIKAYAGHMQDKTQPCISPLFAQLNNLPPTLISVGTADLLFEDNFAMASRLSAAGNQIDLRIYPDAPHGFTTHPTKMAAAALQDIVNWINSILAD